jgi:hypothetical protein
MLKTLSPTSYRPTEAHEHALRLCAEARVAIDSAREIRAESEQLRRDCECWRELWEEYRRGGYLLVCCAYCARVRHESGEWTAIPAEISMQLHQNPQGLLSHGFCDDCLQRHFPRYSRTV